MQIVESVGGRLIVAGPGSLEGLSARTSRSISDYVEQIGVVRIEERRARACRDWAAENFNLGRIGAMYEEFFYAAMNAHTGKGWYQKNPERTQLDWLEKRVPKT
jgi:hypothetical protein